ncbi:MAG: hypothetical protein RI920_1743 [Pseudomonadota bacterium]|jgi:VIT1/CCC1 family predicted Fe2+/Mn2+ transporter
MSMAAGEYVSVHAQADSEGADLARERQELASIYVQRGLEQALAEQVAAQLMAHDTLGTHTRDELGMSEVTAARPLQAAWALGAISARMGGAAVWPCAWRVGFWGAFAMAVTAGAGATLGALTR